ncbi:MAG: hypothetical protein ACYTGH_08180 [Planctomycetota bacterium]
MDYSLVLALLVLAALAFVLALVVTPLMRRLALAADYVDHPGERKIHEKVTPYGGGVAIFVTFMLVLGGGYWAAVSQLDVPGLPMLRAALLPYMAGLTAPQTLYRLAAILGGGTVMFLLSLRCRPL